MFKRILIILIFINMIFAAQSGFNLLGENYIKVIKEYGFPNSIFPVRQNVPANDDVVFMYEFSYFYFFNNRLYRIFYSSEYKEEIYKGIKIGAKKAALTNAFGGKYSLESDGLLWRMPNYLVLAKMDAENRLKGLWLIKEVQK